MAYHHKKIQKKTDLVAKAFAKGYTRTWVKGKAVWVASTPEAKQHKANALRDRRRVTRTHVDPDCFHLIGRLWIILGHSGKLGKRWRPTHLFSMDSFLNAFFKDEETAGFALAELHSGAYDFSQPPIFEPQDPSRRIRAAHARYLARQAGRGPDPLAEFLGRPPDELGEVPAPPGVSDREAVPGDVPGPDPRTVHPDPERPGTDQPCPG